MSRNRASAIIVHQGQLCVMHRKKNGREYYVLPGGGVEEGELPGQTAERETMEEFCVKIKAGRLVYEYQSEAGMNYAYEAAYLSGTPQLDPASVEMERMKADPSNFYEPMWVPLDKVATLNIVPATLKENLLRDYCRTPQKA